MGERLRYDSAISTAEVMYSLLEAEYQGGERELDTMMRRLKDLSAFSLTHAEIMSQGEGSELLALAMFFGATSDPRYHKNQERLALLASETLDYQGLSQVIEQEVARKKGKRSHRGKGRDAKQSQQRLF
jgi:hypothetical protein